MATGFLSYFIKLKSLPDAKIPLGAARRNGSACKRPWTNAYLLQFRNPLLRLTQIGLVGLDEAFDTFVDAWC
jgi:hypothetical protein